MDPGNRPSLARRRPRTWAERALANGVLSDPAFDGFIARRWRSFSALHWTPVAAAVIAARALAQAGATRVLDVGSGVGKFCVLAALATSDACFTGLERRPALVREARRLARTFDVEDRVAIVEGGLDRVDPAEFDAFYLYNPFAERLSSSRTERIDGEPVLDVPGFLDDVATVEGWLGRAADRTRLAILHGFGGRVPRAFEAIARYAVDDDELVLWERTTGEPCAPGRPRGPV